MSKDIEIGDNLGCFLIVLVIAAAIVICKVWG